MTSFALKMTAVTLMLLDHIGLYFPAAPVWFRWLGRGAYPLFLFCMVWSYQHTRSRQKFLLRLYLMSIFMTCFGLFLDARFPSEWGYGNHNIFVPMLLTGVIVSIIERFQKASRQGLKLLGLLALVQLLGRMLPVLLPFARNLSGDVLTGFVPSLAVNEFGFPFIALGTAMYFLKENQKQFCAVYLLFCLWQFSAAGTEGPQWMMILALPLMLRFNGQRGHGWKWFFYAFYPAHTALLFLLSVQTFP